MAGSTAASILQSCAIDPEAVGRALSVDPHSINARPVPGWLSLFLRRPFVAIALPWGLYLRPAALSAEPDRLGALVVHELVHMEQWRRLGVARFLGLYVGEYLRERLRGVGPRSAYLAIGLEREAQHKTASILGTDRPGIS